jgi:hypothetical protein
MPDNFDEVPMFSFLFQRRIECAQRLSLACLLAGFVLTLLTSHHAYAASSKSIREWVSCTGTSDDTSGAIKAFAAAKSNAFTLVVDCPVFLHSGLAIDRGIFIDSNTTVTFSGAGKFIVDNMFHPAFVIANSSNITLTDWNVVWNSSVSINPDVGGYELAGKFVTSGGSTQPAGAFNDLILTPWLAANRAVTFNNNDGWIKSIWSGGVDPMAVFFFTGDTSNVVISGMTLGVPAKSGAHTFLPMAFAMTPNWKSHQSLNGKTPHTAVYAAVPHNLTFSNITLDGTLMGWQGNVQDSMFENITSKRYSDLQDSSGKNVGGIGKWFPPPHLLYLNYIYSGDPKLFNSNIHIENVKDLGPRLGVARDKGGDDTQSGYALSLKLGCDDCSVNDYTSARPDGFMDLLPSNNLTVSNVTATFNSEFINYVYPAGIRFPLPGYTNVKFENVTLVDTAPVALRGQIGNFVNTTNVGFVFSNVSVNMIRWGGSDLPLPVIGGTNNDVALDFDMADQSLQVKYHLLDTVSTTFSGPSAPVKAGATTVLTWSSRGANSCTASGGWSGSVGTNGTRSIKAATGSSSYSLACRNSAHAANTAVQVSTN